ncbi:hypothetical protein VTN77DRAFT_2926 [Rasamsonia byssochlamydoides]|uniref:uncharacterized protein n=1 Tax=Rasamsonia byssochlamydoides TaxID=89139 RepID=UPI003743F30C
MQIREIWKPEKWEINEESSGRAAAVKFHEKDEKKRNSFASTSTRRASTWGSRSSSQGREGGLLTWRGRRRRGASLKRDLRWAIPTRGATARNNASPDAGRSLQPMGGNLPEAVGPNLAGEEGQHKGAIRHSHRRRRGLTRNHNTIREAVCEDLSGISLTTAHLYHLGHQTSTEELIMCKNPVANPGGQMGWPL